MLLQWCVGLQWVMEINLDHLRPTDVAIPNTVTLAES